MFWNILKHVHRYNLECSEGRNKLALLTPIQLNHKCKHVYACSVGRGMPRPVLHKDYNIMFFAFIIIDIVIIQ